MKYFQKIRAFGTVYAVKTHFFYQDRENKHMDVRERYDEYIPSEVTEEKTKRKD